MGNLHTQYHLTVEVLSPLHVGNGNELLHDYDYAVHNDRTWVIDQQKLLEATLDASGEFNNEWLAYPPAQFLRDEDYRADSPLFRYVLQGEPENRPLREHIKDVWGWPYLPGSTLKGMLRTLLLWGLYETDEGLTPDLNKLDRGRTWAGQPLERQMLGSTPNTDLLRALHVSDSTPVEPTAMRVVSAHVYPTASGGRGAGGPARAEPALRGASPCSSAK